LIHEVSLCGFWFHPLVWLAGPRLDLYRELSCDESVIQSARGADLVSALAKLASPEETFLLQARASSLIRHRPHRLAVSRPRRWRRAANALLAMVFVTALLAGVFGTISHTACCLVGRH